MRAVETNSPKDLHYSSIFTVRRQDYDAIRALLLDAIERFKKTVADSKDETEVCALTMDLFRC